MEEDDDFDMGDFCDWIDLQDDSQYFIVFASLHGSDFFGPAKHDNMRNHAISHPN